MPVALATSTVTFVSPHALFRAVRRSEKQAVTSSGEWHTVAPEVVYEFQPQGRDADRVGVFTIEVGRDPLNDAPPFDFVTGEGQLQDGVDWLRAFAASGQPLEEIMPLVPESGPVLLALAEAQLAGDLDTVERIGDEENATWQRADVLHRAKAAYDALQPPKTKT